ncbi:hypothetical protein [Rubellimicrobium roseum]|uniref:Uncharacterized protein n=1 Tax=Rubellimicrobium roseum TaxID=687525 RepID=A0A5C4NA63_9RHOB|nr:hypothetical protein [Rubellimicrobium roseum]TNC59693.1 hypothetical protein FHG71_22575 [Rubellimicrobium roseum]
MGYVLLASFLGILEAVVGLVVFDLDGLAALGVWSLGGNLSAMLVIALCHMWPTLVGPRSVIPESDPEQGFADAPA